MGSTTEEVSAGAIDGSEDPRGPPRARTVQFEDHLPPAPRVQPEEAPRLAAPGKVNRAVTDLPHFAGKTGESLRDFLSRMAMAAEMGNWEPGFQRTKTHYQLRGTAMQYIDGLPADQVCTLESLEAALKARYQGKLVQKDSKEELRVLKRRASETPEDYGLRIQSLTRTAFPGNKTMQEEEGVSAFLRGLPDQKAAETLLATGKDTVQDCVQTLAETERHRTSVGRTQAPLRLRQLEEQQEGSQAKGKARGPPPPAAQTPATELRLAEVEKKLDALQGQIQGQQGQMQGQLTALSAQLNQLARRPKPRQGPPPPQHPSKDRPCLNCGSDQHWASSCPEKRHNRSGQDRRSGNNRGLDPRSGGQSGASK